MGDAADISITQAAVLCVTDRFPNLSLPRDYHPVFDLSFSVRSLAKSPTNQLLKRKSGERGEEKDRLIDTARQVEREIEVTDHLISVSQRLRILAKVFSFCIPGHARCSVR